MKFDYTLEEYRNLDGSGNNETDGAIGTAGVDFLRVASADYDDGISSPGGVERPGAREISNAIFNEPEPILEPSQISNFFWAWGQFIDHDIDISGGDEAEEMFNIPVPAGDPYFDPDNTGTQEIELTRSGFNPATGTDADTPREQVNDITAFLDASVIYGSDVERSTFLRDAGGKLKLGPGDYLPYNEGSLDNAGGMGTELFVAGDIRANENVPLTTLHTLFVREHNRLVDEISEQRPDYDADQLYEEAKAIVEAQIQAITYNQFLPLLLGPDGLPDYDGYDPSVDPGVSNMFATAAYRVGHTMLSPEIQRLNGDGSEFEDGNLQLRDVFFRPDLIVDEGGLDPVLRGLAAGQAHMIDAHVVDDVRNFLFGPPGAGGFDLVSLNIQRGRDHGLATYNDAREAFGLSRVSGFDQITSDVELQTILSELYETVDDIDPFVGGLLEDRVEGAMVGEFFLAVLVDQFSRIRDGDRFWYEERFSGDTLAELQTLTLADIIERNTDIDHIQDEIFFSYERIGGSDVGDILRGADDSDLILGFAGDDRLYGRNGNDHIFGDEGEDKLKGNSGDDVIEGGPDNDTIIGGSGADILSGDGGMDKLVGGSGNDTLNGGTGDDLLKGRAGDDVIDGGEGDDVLEGDRGTDFLDGGNGDDTYRVHAREDSIDTYADSGTDGAVDTLDATRVVKLFLGAGFSAASSGIEVIVGNNSRLYAGDTAVDWDFTGITLTGINAARGSSQDDTISGSGGTDKLKGLAGNDNLSGGADADKLIGGGGSDTLAGGTGNDVLKGGTGADTFVFDTNLQATNIDTIKDFQSLEDVIVLDDDFFTTLTTEAGDHLSTDEFRANVTGVAEDPDDRIIYNITTGDLFYDADGAGGENSTKFAHLNGAPSIDSDDFIVSA